MEGYCQLCGREDTPLTPVKLKAEHPDSTRHICRKCLRFYQEAGALRTEDNPPPCRCGDSFILHAMDAQAAEAKGYSQGQCMNAECGCSMYRPDPLRQSPVNRGLRQREDKVKLLKMLSGERPIHVLHPEKLAKDDCYICGHKFKLHDKKGVCHFEEKTAQGTAICGISPHKPITWAEAQKMGYGNPPRDRHQLKRAVLETLQQMLAEGLVRVKKDENGDDLYELTEKGRAHNSNRKCKHCGEHLQYKDGAWTSDDGSTACAESGSPLTGDEGEALAAEHEPMDNPRRRPRNSTRFKRRIVKQEPYHSHGKHGYTRDEVSNLRKCGICNEVDICDLCACKGAGQPDSCMICYGGPHKNPAEGGLTVVGERAILVETSGGSVTRGMGRVLGLKDGSILIEGTFKGSLASLQRFINGRLMSIAYYDVRKAKAEGKPNPRLPWKHDFATEQVSMNITQRGLHIKGDRPLWGIQ